MRFYLFSLSLVLAINSFAMENDQQPETELCKNLNAKRSFLSGSPEAHRNLRAQLEWVRAVTYSKQQRCNHAFVEQVIANGFLKIPNEFLIILNQVSNNSSSDPKQKNDIETTYNHIRNTTNFFVKDREASLLDDDISSGKLFKTISRKSKVLDAYKALKQKYDKTNDEALGEAIALHVRKEITKHGVKFPEPTSDGRINILKLLELNESNPIVHDNSKYDQMEKLARTCFIVGQTLDSLAENNLETEKKLAMQSEGLEQATKEIWDSVPKRDCALL